MRDNCGSSRAGKEPAGGVHGDSERVCPVLTAGGRAARTSWRSRCSRRLRPAERAREPARPARRPSGAALHLRRRGARAAGGADRVERAHDGDRRSRPRAAPLRRVPRRADAGEPGARQGPALGRARAPRGGGRARRAELEPAAARRPSSSGKISSPISLSNRSRLRVSGRAPVFWLAWACVRESENRGEPAPRDDAQLGRRQRLLLPSRSRTLPSEPAQYEVCCAAWR